MAQGAVTRGAGADRLAGLRVGIVICRHIRHQGLDSNPEQVAALFRQACGVMRT
jgi:hypothetical protein